MVLVEARVFGGDDGVLEVGRDLAEWHELVAFAIGLAMNPGLHAALHVHRSCGRVDPSSSHKGQRGKRPENDYRDDNPSNEGAEDTLATRTLICHIWSISG